jgi:hypothetical protein
MTTFKLRRFDLSFRTAYAQAKDLARAQGLVPLLTAGSVQIEKRNGSNFAYRYRYDGAGKRIAEYLGPENASVTATKIERAQAEIRDSEVLAGYSRDLRNVGFYSADNSTQVTVAALANAGLFGRGAVLIGTHAMGVILNDLGAAATPFPLTEDVDIARAKRIEVATLPKGGFFELLKQTGLPFHEIPQLKANHAPTSYKVRGKKLIVDLLVPSEGRPFAPVKVAELGAHATGLPHLRYLLANAQMSVLLGRDRIVPVAVPDAGRYCVHKLAVHGLRGGGAAAKRDKDVFQAAVLAAVLAEDGRDLFDAAMDAMNRELKKEARTGTARALALLARNYPAAADMLAPLA